MQALSDPEILANRQALLVAVEKFVAVEYAELSARSVSKTDFHYYVGFFNPGVFDLIAWEQIRRDEVSAMPRLKAYFIAAMQAAYSTHLNYGIRDKEYDKGNPRRHFKQIAAAELAANILPRLKNILQCWGVDGSDQGNEKGMG